MANIFIRTSIAPYRLDTYNALHKELDMKMCFYEREGIAQRFDIDALESQCVFKPIYLKGLTLGGINRKLCFGLWRMIHRENPEIVIVPEFQISTMQVLLYRWLTHKTFKVVSMTDDSYDMIVNNNDFTRIHKWLRNNFAKYLDDLIVVTPDVKKWYQEHYGKGIWMPIIMDEEKAANNYERLLLKSQEYAKKYNLEGRKVLLSVSRLVDLKNLYRVIDAFSQTKTDATLVIVGDGPERIALEKYAAQVDKEIIFTGRFDGDELYAWYNLASVFILASYLEPFGAVTNEALLAGCRVIISEKAGSMCLVNNENGEVVNPMCVNEITNAIDRQMVMAKVPNLKSIRPNKMTVTFKERIKNLINELKS